MRQHLSEPSEFSYTELGDDLNPVTVFLVPPRVAMQESLPFLRVHAELALQLFVMKRQRRRFQRYSYAMSTDSTAVRACDRSVMGQRFSGTLA